MPFIQKSVIISKACLCIFFFGVFLIYGGTSNAQFLRNLLQENSQTGSFFPRDDRPEMELYEELTYDQIICRDLETFPKKISETVFASYYVCKKDLDRIEDASYIDLTYRVRRDADRLDLYLAGGREIYICDGRKLSRYEHNERNDPDWWMISRTSLSELICPSDDILIETID